MDQIDHLILDLLEVFFLKYGNLHTW